MLSLAARRGQSAVVKLEAGDLSIGGAGQRIEIGRLILAGRASGLTTTPRGQLDLSLSETTAGAFHFSDAKGHVERGPNAQLNLTANAKGIYLAARGAPEQRILPLALDVAGNWRRGAGGQRISLTRLKAVLAGDSAELLRPLHVGLGGGNARVEDLALNIAGGKLTGSAALEGDALTAKLTGQAIPLKPFGQLTGEPALGTIDLTAELSGPASAPAGHITMKGRGLRFVGLGKTANQLPPLDVALVLVPANGAAQLQGSVAARGSELIAATGTIPLRLSVRPLSAAIPENEKLDLRVAGDGRLEKLAEILPLGEDQIAGGYRISLSVGGTSAQPDVGGRIVVSDASYLNQDYGTQLRGLNLELVGDRGRLQLTRLAAGDGKAGVLQGSGSLDLAATPSPTLDFQTKLTRFLLANSDDAQAAVDGDIRASGSLLAPRLYARIMLPRGEFRIPDQLPPSIARLDVIEIDSRDPQSSARVLAQAGQRAKANPAIPIDLDIEVTVPGQTFLRGHGLDSEWRGKIGVSGNSTAPSVDGGLEAVRGTLSVLGKDFTIRRGTVRFPTGSPSDAWIDILAEYVASDITAQATFTGSLSAPRLQLSSTPSLPQDEILARVLFNTDASHITTAQGLQLAFAAQTLASGGPGVLDRLRNTLGLDRLSLANGTANGPTGGTTAGGTTSGTAQSTAGPVLSGGKYIAPGVFVGAEQGADTASSRAKVEVDLLPHVTGSSSVGASNSNRLGLDWRTDY
jgi:translocation and assembly module TamB